MNLHDADADDDWEELRKKYGRAGGQADPSARVERFAAALKRLSVATPRSAAHERGLKPMPGGGGLEFDPTCNEPMVLPARVTEYFTRGDVAVVVADPNVGKSQLLATTAMAIAYVAVPELLGEAGDGWLGPALFVSNEEKPAYVRARWKTQQRDLPADSKRDKLVVWEEPLALGRFEDSLLVPSEDGCAFAERLADWAEQGVHFAFIAFDPLISLFGGGKENDSGSTTDAIRFLKRIAEAAYAAVAVAHHTSKATRGQETAVASRGSTGTEAASDAMSTLIVVPEAEHNALGFPRQKIERILRHKGVRARGAWAGTHYFEREIVNVAAEDERFPDELVMGTVAIVKPIALPAKAGVSLFEAHQWLWEAHQTGGKDQLTRGRAKGGAPGFAVLIIMNKGKCDRKSAEKMVDDLEQLGRVRIDTRYSRSRNPRLVVIPEPPAVNEWVDETEDPV